MPHYLRSGNQLQIGFLRSHNERQEFGMMCRNQFVHHLGTMPDRDAFAISTALLIISRGYDTNRLLSTVDLNRRSSGNKDRCQIFWKRITEVGLSILEPWIVVVLPHDYVFQENQTNMYFPRTAASEWI
jgi:hypothetical protein